MSNISSENFHKSYQHSVASDFSCDNKPAAWADTHTSGPKHWGEETWKFAVNRLPSLNPAKRPGLNNLTSAAVSGDGSLLAVSAGTCIQIIDLYSKELKHTFRVLDPQTHVHFHPSRQLLLVGSSPVRVWDIEEELALAKQVAESVNVPSIARDVHQYTTTQLKSRARWSDEDISNAELLNPFEELLTKACVERDIKPRPTVDGSFLCFAPAGARSAGSLFFYRLSKAGLGAWNLDKQSEVFTIPSAHTDLIMWAGVHPEGHTVATAAWDRTVQLRKTSDGCLIRTLDEGKSQLWTGAFSPAGDIIAIGCGDQTVKLWNVDTGELLQVLVGFKNWVRSLAFSPTDGQLAAGDGSGVVQVFCVPSGEVEQRYEVDASVNKYVRSFMEVRGIKYDNKGRLGFQLSDGRVVVYDAKVNVKWEFERGATDHSFHGDTGNFVFLTNREAILKADVDDSVRIWPLAV